MLIRYPTLYSVIQYNQNIKLKLKPVPKVLYKHRKVAQLSLVLEKQEQLIHGTLYVQIDGGTVK